MILACCFMNKYCKLTTNDVRGRVTCFVKGNLKWTGGFFSLPAMFGKHCETCVPWSAIWETISCKKKKEKQVIIYWVDIESYSEEFESRLDEQMTYRKWIPQFCIIRIPQETTSLYAKKTNKKRLVSLYTCTSIRVLNI